MECKIDNTKVFKNITGSSIQNVSTLSIVLHIKLQPLLSGYDAQTNLLIMKFLRTK